MLLALQVLAFWPVWRWYGLRISGSPDESWGLLALGTSVVLLFRGPREQAPKTASLAIPTVLIALYAGAYFFLPPIFRAALAVVSVGYTASVSTTGRRPGVHHVGLLLLSLPVIASLQFYLGFPLRAATAAMAAAFLGLNGFQVNREGTALVWGEKLILVDAPCSGVRMLWVGLFLGLTLAAVYGLSRRGTLAAVGASAVIVLAGNVLRASTLFYIEAGLVQAPSWAHGAVGVVVFIFSASALIAAVRSLAGRCTWSRALSTSSPA